jgi:predicted ATPase
MIKRITIENYMAHQHTTLELGPGVTVLTGPNNTGKSDERQHRRFLVLDEQDCWLRPDLVPHFMAIFHTIAHKLNFQVLVISHHDVDLFRTHADRIYRISPALRGDDGVTLHAAASPHF